MQHIKTPVDLTALDCLSKSAVQQAIDTAYPFPKQGMIIWDDDAPDVTADTHLAYFLWGKTVAGVPNKEIYYWDGAAWTLLPLIDGAFIANGSISLTKLSLSGSSPYYIIQVNPAGTALVWVDIISAIQNGTLPPAKLVVPNNTDRFLLTGIAGVPAFITESVYFAGVINVIPLATLVNGTANYFLRMKADGSAADWRTADIADILAAGSAAGQSIRRNASNNAWEFYNASSVTFIEPPATVYNGGNQAWTTYNAVLSIPLAVQASAVILGISNKSGTTGETSCLVEVRKNSGTTALRASYNDDHGDANTYSTQFCQGIYPLDTAHTFDYQVTTTTGNAEITLIGYLP